MYIPRTLEKYVKKISEQVPVLLVTGARQVGKTTFLRHISEKSRVYVTLDDPMLLNLAQTEPALFMQRFPAPVLIDEIQYAPQLLPYIKMAADNEKKAGMFWLTGSQQFQMMKGVCESLAGRIGIVQLSGFSRLEISMQGEMSVPFLPIKDDIEKRVASIKPASLKEIYRAIWRGSFPAVAMSEQTDWNLFYSSYVTTYLQRDIHDLARVGDEMAFLRFLRAAAARTAGLLNVSELARDSDVAPNTAKSWLSILQASGIVYILEPYHTNLTKRLAKMSKLYFMDTGLCSYLTEWSSAETLEAGAMSGAFLETYILTEMLKSYWYNGQRAPFYYYRGKDTKEIDLLIVRDGTIYPLEFKKTASPRKDDVRNFSILDKLGMPVADGGVVCLVDKSVPITDRVFTVPVYAI